MSGDRCRRETEREGGLDGLPENRSDCCGSWMLDRLVACCRQSVRSSRLLIIIGELLAIDPCFGAARGASCSEHYHASDHPLSQRCF